MKSISFFQKKKNEKKKKKKEEEEKRLDTLSLPLSCLFPELSVKFTKEH
jgi:hypothetical protein